MCWRRQVHKLKQGKPIKSVLYCLVIFMFLVACSSDQTTSNASPTETVAEPTPLPFVTAIPDAENVQLVHIAGGFERPLFLTHAGDGSGRLFVVEQAGLVHIIRDGEVLEEPFLDISQKIDPQIGFNPVENNSETGLLGMAFHPNYPENGMFFIYYTDLEGDSALARYRVNDTNPNHADPESEQIILTVDQPDAVHNGGMLAFGPEGHLYLGLGDGGQGYFALYSQLPAYLLGSIIRIDVHVTETAGYEIPADNPFVNDDDVRKEVWSYGLRNPWRFSFDRVTGDLWIGDVGSHTFEEVNYQPAESSGGENYGWPYWEALNGGYRPIPLTETTTPVFYYSHEHGISITAGYVYRGEAIADLYGVFLFGDFGSGQIWTMYRREDGGWQVNDYIDTEFYISSFGEDEEGELYVVDYFEGIIWKFVPQE